VIEARLQTFFCQSIKMSANPPTPAAGLGTLLKGETISKPFRDEVVASLASLPRKPRLVGILATEGPSRVYAEFTRRTCEDVGVEFVLREIGAAAGDKEGREGDVGVEEAIIDANEDEEIDGIMVYYPIYGAQRDHYLQQVVSPRKDVEGLNTKFHYNLYHNIRYIDPQTLSASPTPVDPKNPDQAPPGTVKSILPCTPLAIVKILESIGVYNKLLKYGDRAYGRTVTVINRSEVVGRPLAALLANDGALVFSVDIGSIEEYTKRPPSGTVRKYHPHHISQSSSLTLEECLARSDVVISAVPSAEYKVKTSQLKDGCVCINVSSEKNFEKDVREKAGLYLPSVGKITILMLLRNLVRMQGYR